MPRLDGTGPFGKGPRSGYGFGNCFGNNNNDLQQIKLRPRCFRRFRLRDCQSRNY